jgi:hypothetical protein
MVLHGKMYTYTGTHTDVMVGFVSVGRRPVFRLIFLGFHPAVFFFHPPCTSCVVVCAPLGTLGEGAPSGRWPAGIWQRLLWPFPANI